MSAFNNSKVNDNHGHPKQEYLDKLSGMDDDSLRKACEEMIWLSAYANNNPHSDYHWQCDACHDECVKRNKREIYSSAHEKVSSNR